jgi:hypothetical protein
MPKDRKLTYSDRQSQATRDKKQAAKKKMAGDNSSQSPAPIVRNSTGKR